MIRTIIKRHFHINHRMTGFYAFSHSFYNAFLSRRNEFLGNNAAFNFIDKLKARAAFCGFNPEPNMAVLATAAGLPDILSFRFGNFFNSFFVSHLRPADIGAHFKFPFHPLNNNFKMELAHSGNNGFAGFKIGFNPKSWIFFRQTPQSQTHFFLVGFCLWLNLLRNNRFWKDNPL